MFGVLPPSAYGSSAAHELERAAVFERAWLCVGLTDELATHHQFLVRQLADTSVVVQNFSGQLKAFVNVCSHRFMRLQCEAQGTRALRCRSHGWTYDADGVPTGVPFNESCFGLDEAGRRALRLEAWQVATCGRFVFVRRSAAGPSLDAFLGPAREVLLHCSERFTDAFDERTLEFEVNWKVVVENALEALHVPTVHATSFASVFDGLSFETERLAEHAAYTSKLGDESARWWAGVRRRLGFGAEPRYAEYFNLFVFPSLVLTVAGDGALTFQCFDPLGPRRTRFSSRMFFVRTTKGRATPVHRAVCEQLAAFSRQVVDEDAALCREVQAGLDASHHSRAPLFGTLEARLAHFHEVYARWVPAAATAHRPAISTL
jgi:nitrite reductase/ring-hydroxylating ferredoxin subunit